MNENEFKILTAIARFSKAERSDFAKHQSTKLEAELQSSAAKDVLASLLGMLAVANVSNAWLGPVKRAAKVAMPQAS